MVVSLVEMSREKVGWPPPVEAAGADFELSGGRANCSHCWQYNIACTSFAHMICGLAACKDYWHNGLLEKEMVAGELVLEWEWH